MINSYGMQTHQGLFYADGLGNHIHVYIFSVVSKGAIFALSPLEKEEFSNRSFRPIDWTVTGITTESKCNREKWLWRSTPDSTNLYDWSFTIRCSFFSYPGHPFKGEHLPLYRGCSRQCILSSSNNNYAL